ncbi:MAG: glucans biosynthesis glucosyltransferase MdoH [Hyphomicrobiaceae bacterium]|nr:glucans biosynthesis glucosyltransferase MdoH [Hyphomicrobiaceae bacterium]
MTASSHNPDLARTADRLSLTTPAGLQANAKLARRRLGLLVAWLAIWATLGGWFASIVSSGGWTLIDGVLLICFLVGTPWAVLGLCNAAIGLWLRHGARDGLAETAPFLSLTREQACEPLRIRTAVLMTVRNEDPERALRRLQTVKQSLDATGEGGNFAYFVLSDTQLPDVAAREEAAVARWQAAEGGGGQIVYRRRAHNTGFKAGNVRDFCETYGRDFELMLPLDADSLMTGDAIVELVRIMQAHRKIGILQSLVVGMPSSSPFARLFQFGMRFGMRSYTMGQAWWVGDCGPFWGHNALVRIAPFTEHCGLPLLPGAPPLGGHVLSHDQVEATLMRRAGFEVRVMPIERGSYEENPPDVLEFIHRDVRWCQGNMQYLKLLGTPGLHPVSRFQLVWAILMFIGVPAWTVMIALSPFAAHEAMQQADFPATSAKALYVTYLLIYLTPKLAGLLDAALTKGEVARFGGALRFWSGGVMEIVFSFLQGAITTIRTSIFMAGLLFGKSIVWSGQNRDAKGVGWATAARALWPQTLFGILVMSALYAVSPPTLLWSLPLTAGYILAIPFAVITANPKLGRFMQRHRIAAIPEEIAPVPEIVAVQSGAELAGVARE